VARFTYAQKQENSGEPMPRKVFVAVPVRQPEVKVFTLTALTDAIIELAQEGMAMSLFVWSGDPLISHARNVILAEFLRSDCDDLVFVDDDVSWAPGTLVKLLKHPVDFVAGVYRHKIDDESYPVNLIQSDGRIPIDKTGLIEVNGVPFGFARITRKCAEQMFDAAKDKPYFHKNAPGLECRVVFDVQYADGEYFGEDYVFCRKWQALGGKVWVDPEMAINHSGNKVFVGHFGNYLRGPVPAANNDLRTVMKEVAADLKEAGVA
jgi:hypothetical protein